MIGEALLNDKVLLENWKCGREYEQDHQPNRETSLLVSMETVGTTIS